MSKFKNPITDEVLSKVSEFIPYWNEYMDELKAEGEENNRIKGEDFSCLKNFIFAKVIDKEQTVLQKTFAAIESIAESDKEEYYQDILYFFENITNATSHADSRVRFDLIAIYLGPKSIQACKELDEYWGSKTPGIDNISYCNEHYLKNRDMLWLAS